MQNRRHTKATSQLLTVSQISSLISWPATMTDLEPISTPMVMSCADRNCRSVNCSSSDDFPTAAGHIKAAQSAGS